MKRASRGITIIELMIVVAIVGILAGIAFPSYQDHVRRSNRTDAFTSLTAMANAQERYYLSNNIYANTLQLGFPGTSERGYYNLAVQSADATQFTLTATAIAGGPQGSDTGCTAIALTSTGQKTPSTCWQR